MAKRKYVITANYLAMGDRNIPKGTEIELDSSNPGTVKLLELGAIEEVKAPKPIMKEISDGPND